MNDSVKGAEGGLTLRLTLPDGASLPLGQSVIAEVVLASATDADVNAHLNLVEGDLWVDVTGPMGSSRIAWPWPVDAGRRDVRIAAGEALVAAIPLLATDTSAPAFPVPGRYTLVARYAATPMVTLESAPVVLTRTAGDAAATRALADRDVLQSLLSAGVLGAAESDLRMLAGSDHDETRTLAELALGDSASEQTPASARAVAAVFPPHAGVPDERRDSAMTAADPIRGAMLSGDPIAFG